MLDEINKEYDMILKNERRYHIPEIPKESIELKWLSGYPDLYDNGQFGIGYQIVNYLLSHIDGVFVDRIFIFSHSFFEKMTQEDFISIELRARPGQFDVFSFSLPYELNYLHSLKMLQKSGIPLRKEERNHNHPLIVGGGYAISYNPEPLTPFYDFFVIGEAETCIQKIAEVIKLYPKEKREELLAHLANIEGIYVPGISQQTKKVFAQKIFDLPYMIPDLRRRGKANYFFLEHVRGCHRSCRFCIMGYGGKKPRVRDLESVKFMLSKIKLLTNTIRLFAPSDAENPYINEIYTHLREEGYQVFVGSQRTEQVSCSFLKNLVKNQDKLSIAPETGAERLKRVINKDIPNELIFNTIQRCKGLHQIFLYMFVGIPTEKDEDLMENAEFIKEIRRYAPKESTVYIYINAMIPKPLTPFQWAEQVTPEEFKRKLFTMLSSLQEIPGLKFQFMDNRNLFVQGLLARGGHETQAILELMVGQDDIFENWLKTCTKLNYDYHQSFRERAIEEELPWHRINFGVSDNMLKQEWINAKSANITHFHCSLRKCIDNCVCKFISGGGD